MDVLVPEPATRKRGTMRDRMRWRAPALGSDNGAATAEYAMAPLEDPGVVFGYGVIDADEIRARMAALRKALDTASYGA